MSQDEYNNIEVTDIESVAIQSMDPLEQIKHAAEKFDVKLNDPNPNCRHCYGRGYTGKRKTGEPIACVCIQPKMNEATKFAYENRQMVARNRKERRFASKQFKKNSKKDK